MARNERGRRVQDRPWRLPCRGLCLSVALAEGGGAKPNAHHEGDGRHPGGGLGGGKEEGVAGAVTARRVDPQPPVQSTAADVHPCRAPAREGRRATAVA